MGKYMQTSHNAFLDGTPKQFAVNCLKMRFLFLKRVNITKRWGLCPQTPAFHTFMFIRCFASANVLLLWDLCDSLYTSVSFVGKGPIIFCL